MIVLHPSLQRALVAYGAGAILAGVVTHALSLGDGWSLLGSGGGAFIVAGALRLARRTFAMRARSADEFEFRRLVLGIAALAAVLGAALLHAVHREVAERPRANNHSRNSRSCRSGESRGGMACSRSPRELPRAAVQARARQARRGR